MTFIRKGYLVSTLVLGIIYGNPITPHLIQKMNQVSDSELIRIYISLHENYNFNLLKNELNNLNKNETRELVRSELKSFYQASQNDILSEIDIFKEQNSVENVKTLWIANVIICEAKRNAIYELAERNDVRRIDFDEYQIVIPEQSNDNEESGQSDSREITWNVTLVNADDVWDEGYTGQGIIVSVIDTGVNYNHQDLNDHMWGGGIFYPLHGYDFHSDDNNPMDDMGHGTHCAGTVAGDGTAGSQTGIAPDAQIMALKVLDASGGGYESSCWEAIEFSVENGADIMSLSLGWLHAWNPDRDAWRNSMNAALFSGLIASVAAGNEGNDYGAPDNVRTPGDVPPPWLHPDQTVTGGLSAVVSVGATNSNDNIANFSARGPVSWENISPFNDYPHNPEMGLIRPDISAPGENIKSLAHYSDTGYESGWSGTSMATPCVAGVMALMKSKDPNLSPAQISEILESTALHLGSTGKNNTYGSGRVEAFAAVEEVFGEPIAPFPAEAPIPADMQNSVSLDSQLRWSNGGGATSYLVFMGTDNPPTNIVYGEWVDSPIYTSFQLDYETEYFWQITSINQYGETVGNIWSFSTTSPPDETFESGDFSMFPWESYGYMIDWPNVDPIEEYSVIGQLENINWSITTDDSYNGMYSAKSSPIDHNQASIMSVNVTTLMDDYIGFNYRVASEYSPSGNYFYDGLMFFIDDQLMGYFQPVGAGETPWTFISYPVPQGNHTFTWAYVKDSSDGSTAMEEDCAWLDDIYFPSIDNTIGNITVDLMSDWNIVGLPILADDLSYLSVYPEAIENTFYYFSPTGYVPASELTPGFGYWLRFTEEQSVSVQGQWINNLDISLNGDWNLISGISHTVNVASIDDPSNLIIPNTLYAFGSSGYYGSDLIEPGQGYWIRSLGEGDIYLTSNLRKENIQTITEHLFCNYISINSNELYFGKGISSENLLSYSLPPVPPKDAYDVRFSNDMKYSSEGGIVLLQGKSEVLELEYFVNSGELWSLSLDNGESIDLTGSGSVLLSSMSEELFLKKESFVPTASALINSFPNPFNPVTTITYVLPENSYIQLDVFTVKGEKVKTIEKNFKYKGKYSVTWDGKDKFGKNSVSGVYLCKLSTDISTTSHKLILLK